MENPSPLNNEPSQYESVGSFIFEIVKIFILAFIIIVPIRMFLFQPFFVQGASMEPNFENNEYLIINELGYKETKVGIGSRDIFTVGDFKEFKREEIAVFKYPKNPSQFFIKRVIGLPGEKIELKNGKIKIYNKENPEGFILDESFYLSQQIFTQGEVVLQLEEDEYFVMGDNRSKSSDSRSWGAVPKVDIIGKVIFRAWPLNRINIF